MQYILNQNEYDEFIKYKEGFKKANKVLKHNYDENNQCFNFNKDTYRMLMSALGNAFGSGYSANVCGAKFTITKNHAEGCRIADMVKKL
ncbi:TPA: hypothetical protein PL548_001404 [Clostridium botulinum]|nr:hypothetical protein [Clostridium botulinum]